MNQDRATDKKLHKLIRNTVILTLLGGIPVLYGMGLLPWATASSTASSLEKQHKEVDELKIKVHVGFARLETKQEAIHEDVNEIKKLLQGG